MDNRGSTRENYEMDTTDVVRLSESVRWLTEDVKAFLEGMPHHGCLQSPFTPLPQATPTLTKAMTARVIASLPAVRVPSRCRSSGGGIAMRGGGGWGDTNC